MPWPFRSRAAGAPAGPASEAAAPSLVPGPAERPSGQWQGLPALTPAIAAPSVAVRPDLAASLPVRWHQPPALQPLGHDITPQAPGGLVTDLARPVPPPRTVPAPQPPFMSNGWRLPGLRSPRRARPDPVPPPPGSSPAGPLPSASLPSASMPSGPRPSGRSRGLRGRCRPAGQRGQG